MEQLIKKRAVLKGQLTRLKNHYSNIKKDEVSESVISQLIERKDKIKPFWDDFSKIQEEIELLGPSENDEPEREHFENLYFEIISEINIIVKRSGLENNSVAGSNKGSIVGSENGSFSKNAVKLPTIEIESFDGQYCNWLGFKDSFNALIDSNNEIHKIQKFLYLRSSLKGEAAEIIKSIELSADNYDDAYQILKDRYEKKSLIIHNHIKAIFESPSILKESFTELRKLYDSFNKHLRSLKTLGENVDSWDRLIIFILTSKFDSITRRDWESYKIKNELPDMKDMTTFLKEKCEVLEKIENNKSDKQKPYVNKRTVSNTFHINSNDNVNNKLQCFHCGNNHTIFKCDDFLKLTSEERIASVKRRKLCMICFKDNHFSWKCKATKKCFKCDKPHNTLLHINNLNIEAAAFTPVSSAINEAATSIGTSSVSNYSELPVASQVLLATALIKIKDENNKVITCRALLDSGSQSHFIREEICKKLSLKQSRVNHVVKGVGQSLTNISNKVNITLMSCFSDFDMNIDCLVLRKITERLPMISFDRTKLNIPNHVQLADPTFNISNEIDILLGSEVFWSIGCHGKIQMGKHLPVLQETKLGWIIAGNLGGQFNSNITMSYLNTSSDSIDDKLLKFWEIEEVISNNKNMNMSQTEKYCEGHFAKTTKRDNTGRFIVNIPFKESLQNLGNSRAMTLKRFYSLERKFRKNADLKREYVTFMNNYKAENHMREISEADQQRDDGYYLPHHAVFKNTSITTKCRVVFDASAKTDTGLSLNDVQFNGPSLQSDIFTILIRFRNFRYVMTADISKMYRQILITENQRKFQKIFWRDDEHQELKCYTLNTVTYGTASAPYLAIRSLKQVGIENKELYPLANKIIDSDFYVDDLLTGSNSKEELLEIQRDVTKILAEAGFDLRKWLCNDKIILNNFKINKELESSVLHIGENEQNKTLGIYWDSNNDKIKYSINNDIDSTHITKRIILSCICQVFDPLGLLGPVIIIAKLIIQELWKEKIGWDDTVSEKLQNVWLDFKCKLSILNNVEIPRYTLISEYTEVQLHGFCDSSEKAYGACIYLRCANQNGLLSSNLLCAKSRVAPLKQISLPRLELCGAVLLANLVKKVVDSLELKFSKIFLWTDSTVTLAWIRGAPNKWKTFVANRVSEIQALTNEDHWYHVRSSENPADLLSRGVSPDSISRSTLWWNGPKWLYDQEITWNLDNGKDLRQEVPEQRSSASCVVCVAQNLIFGLIDTFSGLNKLIRTVAYVLRFVSNCKKAEEVRQFGSLTPHELQNALNLLIKHTQIECFPREYKDLVLKREIKRDSKILNLNPFIHNQLIRVGGRLANSKYGFDKKYPIVLPRGNKLTKLILEWEHSRLLHCGAQLLLSSLRERYWPISGRNSCKGIIRQCVICTKAKPRQFQYIMGNLPGVRVSENLPFVNVGVDYGGPFLLKDRKTRGAKIIKSYICLFVCMCTKAVHLELVSELSTKAFLATLKRFTNRRGKPSNIYSDNGSNFVGANNEINKIFNFLKTETVNIGNNLSIDGVKWHFIPARSPHFGGLWEAGIKSSKFHLKRIIGNQSMTFEQFNTVLVQIEGILNSRPLCPLSSDPNDLTALTPSHFLIGRTITAIPEADVTTIKENRLDKYQQVQAMVQHYWKRWKKEYLAELQSRIKWKEHAKQLLSINSMVLIKDDTAHTQEWRLGRVTNVFPGSDGVVRVVEVRVRGGTLKRAVSQLCVLPID